MKLTQETQKDKGVYIYGLYCPDGNLRYIGKANDLKKRFASHMRDSKRKTPVYAWIRSLISKGKKPEMRMIMKSDNSNWERHETEEIAKARLNGDAILNLADGGNQPKCNHETRYKNGKNSHNGKYPGIFRAKKALGKILKYYINSENSEKAQFIRMVISKVNSIPESRMEWCDSQYSKMKLP
jgi:hypothetical protein